MYKNFFAALIVLIALWSVLGVKGHGSLRRFDESVLQSPQPVATQPQKKESRIVDFEADVMHPVKLSEDTTVMALVGKVVFYHNGAIITCDSAVRYSDKRMECFNNVVINKQTTYIYGDRADYNGDINTASVYAPIIKIVDKDATMYTFRFEFNTLTNVGKFDQGATIKQKDNMLESNRGYYYTDARTMVCVDHVEMRNDDYKIKTDSMSYHMDTEFAEFFVPTYIWNSKGEMLTAHRGSYDRRNSQYVFTSNAYIITKNQEVWADSIEYNQNSEDAVLRNNIQIHDHEQNVISFGDYGLYWGGRDEALLTRNPSALSYDPDPEQDTVYMRSDSMFLYSVNRFIDKKTAGVKEVVNEKDSVDKSSEIKSVQDALQPSSDSLVVVSDTTEQKKASDSLSVNAIPDSTKIIQPQEVAIPQTISAKTIAATVDSIDIRVLADSAKTVVVADSIVNEKSVPPDSMVRVVRAYNNVKIFRKDFQAVCDSLVGFSLDSTIHMYKNPLMWNGANQIKADVIDIYTKNKQLTKAVFTGNPIMGSEVQLNVYNQVKGKIIEALFRDNEIYRTDVNGNGQTLYYMTEEDSMKRISFVGFLVVDCAAISFDIADRTVERIVYKGNPVYSIYPIDMIPDEQTRVLPGFVWEIDRKPTLADVLNREIRASRIKVFRGLPSPYFPISAYIMQRLDGMIKSGEWRDRNDVISNEALEFVRSLGY